MEVACRCGWRGRVLRFEAVEPRLLLSADWTGLDEVRAKYGLTGQGQTVAVIDTGIAYDHAALGGGYGPGSRVVGGFDFGQQDADPFDEGPNGSHGTHVAGVIGSSDPAHLGIAPGVDLVALRVFDDSGESSLGLVKQALEWVHTNRNAFRYPITTVNLSVGSNGNFSELPAWALLEDQLAQLQTDGIFVAAAAGNDFTTYQAAGVDYPAVSPYTAPVAAGDSSGNLASFSQRDVRSLVAPGIGIVSTMPDYAGNHNGIDDDFGRVSGTSMASAFVAGASVLLRQACQQVGMGPVTPQTLYQLMLRTADTLHDPVTSQEYHRLNLSRAIDSAMSQSAPAQDRIDWGTVRQQRFDGVAIDARGQWFTMTAANEGLLTIEANWASGGAAVHLELFDAAGGATGAVRREGGQMRIDAAVRPGATVSLHAFADSTGGAGIPLDFRVTNLVSQSDGVIRVVGTEGNDRFTWVADAAPRFTINGVAYPVGRGTAANVTFDGRGGTDCAELSGSAGTDTAVIRPGSLELSGPDYHVQVIGAELARMEGGDGTDSATSYDSTGDDRLWAAGNRTLLCNESAAVTLGGFEQIRARADHRGDKTAQLASLDFVLQLDGAWVRPA